MLDSALRPGKEVAIALDADLESDRIDVRTSMLHDVSDDGKLLLAQPAPALLRQHIGRQVELTFLIRDPRKPRHRMRVGYRTTILEIVDKMRMSGGFMDDVVVVAAPSHLKPTTLRLHYRVAPHHKVPLKLSLAYSRSTLHLVDISLGGLKYTCPANSRPRIRERIDMELVTGDARLHMRATVVRVDGAGAFGSSGQATVAVRFVEMDPQAKNKLRRLLAETARIRRAEDSGV